MPTKAVALIRPLTANLLQRGEGWFAIDVVDSFAYLDKVSGHRGRGKNVEEVIGNLLIYGITDFEIFAKIETTFSPANIGFHSNISRLGETNSSKTKKQAPRKGCLSA